MTFYHPLLRPLEVKLNRPLLMSQAILYYLVTHPRTDENKNFWNHVKKVHPQWEELAQKWGARVVQHVWCPEFPTPSLLIGWAYELFLSKPLPLYTVNLALQVVKPEPTTWKERFERWRGDTCYSTTLY